MSPLYFVERTTRTGQWATQCVTTRRRRALQIARVAAQHREHKRTRVTVRVRAAHEMPCHIAGWINGGPAWGEAFR